MTNLLEETLKCVKSSGHSVDDIDWVGTFEYSIDLDALDVDYDDGFGGVEIAEDLCIFFDDGSRLVRRDYDGSEWWEFVAKAPQRPLKHIGNARVKTGRDVKWAYRLAGINELEEEM